MLGFVTWFEFRFLKEILDHETIPMHTHCLSCRLFLAELGLFFHKLNYKIRDTVKCLASEYDFVLTADNIDFNGILDLEDYKHVNRRGVTDILISEIMAPYLYLFYGLYNRVGCYFISSPIYPKVPTLCNLLADYERAIYRKIDHRLCARPTYEDFSKFLQLDAYLGFETRANLYDMISDFKLSSYPRGIGFHIYAITDNYLSSNDIFYLDCVRDMKLYVKVAYADLEHWTMRLLNLAKDNEVHTYVYDHPIILDLQRQNQCITLQYWAKALYDANVNITHFKHNSTVVEQHKVDFPIIGTAPAVPIVDCPKCEHIPLDYRMAYEMGTSHSVLRDLDLTTYRAWPQNPLAVLDDGLVHIGDFRKDSIYYYEGNLHTHYIVDYNLLDYFMAQGIRIKLPPSDIEPDDDAEHTITSEYYYTQATSDGILADLKLFNLGRAGSIAPTRLLMAVDYCNIIYREAILTSDGKHNSPTNIFDVKIARKHKSSGIPYNKYGDVGFMLEMYNIHRQALINHHTHSCDTHITAVLKKEALTPNSRQRTILAINANLSELGRCSYRFFLEKIKASAKKMGPVLIGFCLQHLGWNSIFDSLDDGFNCTSCTMRSGKDFPKYDRHVTSLLLYLSAHMFFSLVDPFSLDERSDFSLQDVFHLYLSEAVQVINNLLIANGSAFLKPSGQTSGGSRTADGNTNVHMILDHAAIFELLMRTTDDNFELLRPLRDTIAKTLWDTPRNYMKHQTLIMDWMNSEVPSIPIKVENLDHFYNKHGIYYTIKHCIATSKYLSDDSLMNHDIRFIHMSDIVGEFNLISNYVFAKDKYWTTTPTEGATEFLSQHTFVYNGYFFPRPNPERIIAALFTTSNANVFDPLIYDSRIVALFGVLYPIKYDMSVSPKHKIFLTNLDAYITQNVSNIDANTMNSFDLGIVIDNDFDVMDRHKIFDRLYGFDYARDNPKEMRRFLPPNDYGPDTTLDDSSYQMSDSDHFALEKPVSELCVPPDKNQQCIMPEAARLTFCLMCERAASVICNNCSVAYCNDGTANSHMLLHYKITGHVIYQYKGALIRCKKCRITDFRLIYIHQSAFFCDQHKLEGSLKYYNETIFFDAVHRYEAYDHTIQHCLQQFLLYYLSRKWDYAIRFGMDLFHLGVYRPYYYLVLYLTNLEDLNLKSIQEPIPYKAVTLISDNLWRASVPEKIKYDERSTYLVINEQNTSQNITPLVSYMAELNLFYWDFKSTIVPKQIVRLPFNILANALNAIENKMPRTSIAFIENKNCYNSKLTGDFHNTILYDISVKQSATPNTTRHILGMLNRYIINIIHGPPGTGKTFSAAWLIYTIITNNPNMRILVVGPSHKSVDVLFTQFMDVFLDYPRNQATRVIRVHHDLTRIKSRYKKYYSSMADKQNVVFMTMQSNAISNEPFDLIISDEYSQQSDLYIFLVMQRLKPGGSVVFFGDHEQLSTVDNYRSDNIKYSNLVCHASYQHGVKSQSLESNFYQLTEHYRSHPEICSLVSAYTYHDTLICKTDTTRLKLCTLNTKDNHHIVCIPTPSKSVVSYGNGVFYSPVEIEITKNLLDSYLSNNNRNGTVNILCAYKSQYNRMVDAIGKHCDTYGIRDVSVHTIDSVQGDQADHVILAFTVLNAFTTNKNRLNVAISRAKSSLFLLVPDKGSVSLDPVFDDIPILHIVPYTQTESLNKSTRSLPSMLDLLKLVANDRETYKDNPTSYTCHTTEFSPLYEDYVFLDTEFLTVKKDARRNLPIVLAFSVCNNAHSSIGYGSPVLHSKDYKVRFDVHIDDFVRQRYLVNIFAKCKDQIKTLIKRARDSEHYMHPRSVLLFCLRYCISRPIIVTWAGELDFPFLIPVIKAASNDNHCSCKARAFYYSNETKKYYCQHHASKVEEQITHFTTLQVINLKNNHFASKTSMANTDLFVYYEHDGTLNTSPLSLSLYHDAIVKCDENHGNPHDPDADAAMTRCIFYKQFLSVIKQCDMLVDVQPSGLNTSISHMRHEVIRHFLDTTISPNGFCELGGGNRPYYRSKHNVDPYADTEINKKLRIRLLKEDMNEHKCDYLVQILIDSAYYLKENPTKPSFMFFDANPKHYREGIDGELYYICGLRKLYRGRIPPFDGPSMMLNLGQCSEGLLRKVHLACAVTPCNTEDNGYNICENHFKNIDLIAKIAKLLHFGYKFIIYIPSQLSEAYMAKTYADYADSLKASTDAALELLKRQNDGIIVEAQVQDDSVKPSMPNYETQPLKLLGYDTRDKTNVQYNRTYMKGAELLTYFHSYTCAYASLPLNYTYVVFGAAGYKGDSPLADRLTQYFSSCNHTFTLDLVDPKLTDKVSFHQRKYVMTIGTYTTQAKRTFFIVCDAYMDETHLWFSELRQYTRLFLIKRGIVYFKMTISFLKPYKFEDLEIYCSKFSNVDVKHLECTGITSELWILCYDFDLNNNFNHNIKDKCNLIWYGMTLKIPAFKKPQFNLTKRRMTNW